MSKNITLIGINYYPEDTAIGLYSTQMMEHLAKKGHNITVVTGFPYYPRWEINKEYREKKAYITEMHNGVRILRYKQYVPKEPSFLKRIFHLLSFTIGNLPNLFRLGKQDLVITIVPVTFSIFLGWLLKLRYSAKLCIHIQDFEFDAAFRSDLISTKSVFGKLVKGSVFGLERFLLKRAHMVSSISYSMLKKLQDKTKIEGYFLPNWIDADFVNPEKTSQHPLLNKEKFNILYSGNIGDKQNWDLFVECAQSLKSIDDVAITVVGHGSKRSWLEGALEGLPNVRLYEPIPYEDLPSLLCSADLHILFQKEGMADVVMPSKLLGMMASGVPSLVTGKEDSEVEKAFSISNGGYFFAQNDLSEILEKTDRIRTEGQLKKELGQNARSYVVEHFSSEKVLDNFTQRLEKELNNS